MHALAAEVGARLSGWRVRGATLAAEGALGAALVGLTSPLIYPFFMAEGWFTHTALPRALGRVGASGHQLRPFGADPGLASLVESSALSAGLEPLSFTLAAGGAWFAGIARLKVGGRGNGRCAAPEVCRCASGADSKSLPFWQMSRG